MSEVTKEMKGWSESAKAYIDPIHGIHYKSFKAMCNYYRKNESAVTNRLQKGLSLYHALTWNDRISICVGPSGRVYPSEEEMVRYEHKEAKIFGDDRGPDYCVRDFYRRKELGQSIEECLQLIPSIDYEYARNLRRFEEINMSKEEFAMWADRYWATEDYPLGRVFGLRYKDHRGNRYNTVKQLCETYNVSQRTFEARRQKGWSLQECLEGRWVYDHLGNKYKNVAEMATAWGITKHKYITRIEKGWSMKLALTTYSESPKELTKHLQTIIVEEKSYVLDDTMYFGCMCRVCGQRGILSYADMLEHKRNCQ